MDDFGFPAGHALDHALSNIDANLAAHTQSLTNIEAVVGGHTATLADHTQRLTDIDATLAALTVSVAACSARIANIEALLVPMNVPHLVATITRICQEIAAAKEANHHDRRDIAYVAVPCSNGALPANWPAGFDRNDHFDGPIAVIDALLEDYGAPAFGAAAGAPHVRRNLLAGYIGAIRA